MLLHKTNKINDYSEQESWFNINWYKADRNVKQLQARIVKASKEGKVKKVRDLQRLLTTSFAAKSLAVKRVYCQGAIRSSFSCSASTHSRISSCSSGPHAE